MAGDWIKMRSNLRRHPKVVRLASALSADRLRVVGGLHAVWCLFDEHSEDGCLCGYTPSAIDEEIGWPGFCGQLMAIGWVESDGFDGLSLPEFDTHNGASAKRRAQEADRKRAERQAAIDHPHPVGNPSASNADTVRTREEKRREEKKEDKEAVPAFVLPDWIPSETWTAYCKVRTGKKAKNEPHALGLIVKDLEKFRSAGHDPIEILNNSIKSGWAGVFEPKTKPSVVGVTVPSAPGRDPALQKLDEDARITKPPTLEMLQRLAELKKPRPGAH